MDMLKFPDLRERGLDLVVLFGSRAKGTARPGSDTDLALQPSRPGLERLKVEGELAGALGQRGLDFVWLPEASWLLAWEVAQGQLVFESRPGLFQDFRSLAWLRKADSRVWVERDRDYLRRAVKGSWTMNLDLLRRKLTAMSQYLRELEPQLTVSAAEFASRPEHYIAERLTQLLVDCAAAINTEVAQVVAGIPPSDYYSSFFSLARTGWIDSETASALAPIAQLRNRLVHDYEAVDLSELHRRLQDSLPSWHRYVSSVFDRVEAWTEESQ